MPWLDDIVTVLEDAGVGVLGVNIFVGSRATVPAVVSGEVSLHVVATPGTSPEHTHNSVIVPGYVQPGAQLCARGEDLDLCYALAQDAYNACYAVRNQFINSGWYKWIRPTQEPYDLGGVDDRDQVRVAFNVLGNKRP